MDTFASCLGLNHFSFLPMDLENGPKPLFVLRMEFAIDVNKVAFFLHRSFDCNVRLCLNGNET